MLASERTADVKFRSNIPDALESAVGLGGDETGPYAPRNEMTDRVHDYPGERRHVRPRSWFLRPRRPPSLEFDGS